MDLNKRKPRSVVLEFDDEKLSVNLKKAVPFGKMSEFAQQGDSPDNVVQILLEFVESWDLNRDGVPVPIDLESLHTVDYDVLKAILSKILENPTEAQV